MNAKLDLARRDSRLAESADRPLRILHVLDHSLPLHSGYTFRTLAILTQQRALGWETFQLTSPKQDSGDQREETIGNWMFSRTPPASGLTARLPLIQHRALMSTLSTRLAEVVASVRPDIIHAHSPVLNALPALEVGRTAGIPVVYEVRAFWEDAAVDHGTAREWGPRYRLTRALETRALQRADAVTTICDGLRRDMLERGIPANKITVIPNAVDVSEFSFKTPINAALAQQYGLTPGKTLGFAGSFYGYEGLDVLLQAMPLVLHAEPQARLMLVGGGPQEDNLKRLSDRAWRGRRRAFHGARAACRCRPLLQCHGCDGLPPHLATPHRPGDASETTGGDGHGQTGGGFGCGWARRIDQRWIQWSFFPRRIGRCPRGSADRPDENTRRMERCNRQRSRVRGARAHVASERGALPRRLCRCARPDAENRRGHAWPLIHLQWYWVRV